MARAETEPTDGFLDREFASFRKARLRAKRASEESALEPRRSRPAEGTGEAPAPAAPGAPAPASAPSSIEAMLESLDPGSIDEATRAGPRPEADALPKVNKVPALSALVPTDDATDETRSHARADLPPESCSDPEFEKFRAARATGRHAVVREPADGGAREVGDRSRTTHRADSAAPSSDRHARPAARTERTPSSNKLPRPAAPAPAEAVEGSCSDPEFEKFRAARRPDSARHRKPVALEPRPAGEVGVPEPAAAAGPASAPARADDVEGSCSDPEFEKFRAARQGRPDSARLRKPEPAAAAPSPAPAGAPEPVAAAVVPPPLEAAASDAPETAPTDADDDAGMFFGTSVRERAKVRARVLEARSDVDPAAGEVADPPTPSGGERRRAPPPPLPERP